MDKKKFISDAFTQYSEALNCLVQDSEAQNCFEQKYLKPEHQEYHRQKFQETQQKLSQVIEKSRMAIKEMLDGLDASLTDSEFCLGIAKIYYKMSNEYEKFELRRSRTTILFLENALSYIASYKKLSNVQSMVMLGYLDPTQEIMGIETSEADIWAFLTYKYAHIKEEAKALEAADNAMSLYKSMYGDKSDLYAKKLFGITTGISQRAAVISKWANPNVRTKAYGNVWWAAFQYYPLSQESQTENFKDLECKIHFLELAEACDPGEYTKLLSRWNAIREEMKEDIQKSK